MTHRIAIKRLAAVEVVQTASHQHEFNAGTLRHELEFPSGRTQGKITFLFLTAASPEPIIEDSTFTLYDAREGHPTRSEYRLYYSSPAMSRYARAGDLLVLSRPNRRDADLQAVVVSAGSETERLIQGVLLRDGKEGLKKFLFVDVPRIDTDTAAGIVEPILAEGNQGATPDVLKHPLYLRAIASGVIPKTEAMAKAAQDILESRQGSRLSADAFVEGALDAESQLYFAIENEVYTKRLSQLTADGNSALDDILGFATSLLQSRKARRGLSLQNHFGRLLRDRKIPFEAQCRTERGKTPDFIIPGGREYHDPRFPAERLRMVGCKTLVRERSPQWLVEAARVRVKYGLTLDPNLSDELVDGLAGELLFFLPAGVLARYGSRPCRPLLGNIEQLVAELKKVV